jgi:hypothetical protein
MVTLAEAKVGMADKVDQAIIDEFRRGSFLLDKLLFDDAVSPGTGGSTLTYGYIKLKTPSTAAFRALNGEYTNNEAKREKASADVKIFGGNFKIDRVLINTSGAIDELDFQTKEKINGAINLFHYTVINGDSAVHELEFDGLDTLLTGTSTEFNTSDYVLTSDTAIDANKTYYTRSGSEGAYVYTKVASPVVENIATYYEDIAVIDLSSSKKMDENYQAFLDKMDEFESIMQGKPSMYLGNNKLITKMTGIARRAGYLTHSEDAFGKKVAGYNGVPMVDLEEFYNGTTTVPCVPIDATSGETSLYAIQIAKDGFHGVTLIGNKLISIALPDLKAPGTVKEGDIEMVAAVVLKNTLKAGVFRKIRVK